MIAVAVAVTAQTDLHPALALFVDGGREKQIHLAESAAWTAAVCGTVGPVDVAAGADKDRASSAADQSQTPDWTDSAKNSTQSPEVAKGQIQ